MATKALGEAPPGTPRTSGLGPGNREGVVGVAFIGRDREQAELRAGLRDALRGRGGVFLITGEPGIGKTALADQLAHEAAEQGARVVWGRSWAASGAAPCWAWAQIVRALIEGLDEAALRRLPSARTAPLARLAPEIAERFGGSMTSTREPDSDADRFYLFDAITYLLKQVSSGQPLVLVLDDLLAGDRSTLLLLQFLAPEVRAERMLVIGTYRDVEANGSTEVADALAALFRDSYLLGLGELDRKNVEILIAEIAGVPPNPAKVTAIHEATGGNPLFVREVTRLLAGRDSLDRPGRLSIPVPDSVRPVIRQRLAPLSTEAMQVLSAAAVVGRDFDLALVGAASALSGEAVLSSLAESVALGVVAQAVDTPGVYRFSHPLMREAIYEGLPLPDRTRMHQRVGETLELLHGPDSPSHVGELAYHFVRSAGRGGHASAGEYAQRAGDRAMDACAYEEAVVQYRRALDSLPIGGPVEPERRCELLLRLGWAQARTGEYHDARPTFLLAADIARELGNACHLGSAALGIGEQLIEGGRVDRQLVALLEEAIERLGSEDSALRVRLLARLSLELTFADEARGEPPSLEAIRIARRVGNPRALADALRARWMAQWGPAGLAERSALAEELLAIARATNDRERELIGLAQRATCSLQGGVGTAVEDDISAHARLAAELRMPYHEWAAGTMRAGRALLTGSLQDVEALAQDALDRLPGRSNARIAYLVQLSALRWEQGRLGELRDDWEELVASIPQIAFTRAWLCLATFELGRDEAARAHLQDLVAVIPGLPRDGLWPLAVALTALAAAELEDADAAAVLYPLLLPHADDAIVLPMLHPALCVGAAAFYLGLLATEIASWDDAEGHFESAIDANQRLGARPLLARTRYEYARMLTRRGRAGDRHRAHELLGQAAATAAELALPRTGERIEALRNLAATGKGAGDGVSEAEDARTLPEQPSVTAAGNGQHVFRREGDYWTIDYAGTLVRLADTKGIRCLSRLLTRPGEQVLAVDLEAWDGGNAHAEGAASGLGGPTDGLEKRADLGDAGELLDAQAKAAYKARLDDLREEAEEAERFNDPGRIARAREETDFLTSELARAVGLGGRDRKAASHAERARLNVTRAVRAAMKNLERVHPPLAEHLALTIRTGRYCSYSPDPRVPIHWKR